MIRPEQTNVNELVNEKDMKRHNQVLKLHSIISTETRKNFLVLEEIKTLKFSFILFGTGVWIRGELWFDSLRPAGEAARPGEVGRSCRAPFLCVTEVASFIGSHACLALLLTGNALRPVLPASASK